MIPSFVTATSVTFYSILDWNNDVADQLFNQDCQLFYATEADLSVAASFAEQQNCPGIIVFWQQNVPYIMSSAVYDYRTQHTHDLAIIFNAELALHGDAEYEISIWLSDTVCIGVPIRHAYCNHILWHDELSEIFDTIDAQFYLQKLLHEFTSQADDFDEDWEEDDWDDDDWEDYIRSYGYR